MNPLDRITAGFHALKQKTSKIISPPPSRKVDTFLSRQDSFSQRSELPRGAHHKLVEPADDHDICFLRPPGADERNAALNSATPAKHRNCTQQMVVVQGVVTTSGPSTETEIRQQKTVKKVLLCGSTDTASLNTALTALIDTNSNVINNLVLRACVKIDALDWLGSVDDCDLVLKQDPQHSLALMLRAVCLVQESSGRDVENAGEKIAQGIVVAAASQTCGDRYAAIVAYAVSESSSDEAVEQITKLVEADDTDRCALALLLTMHFKRWYWGRDPEGRSHSIAIAEEMQQKWPNDRVSMSALCCLIGSPGKGNRAAIDFESRNIRPTKDVHHKSSIRPRLALDYPMYIQRPDLASMLM